MNAAGLARRLAGSPEPAAPTAVPVTVGAPPSLPASLASSSKKALWAASPQAPDAFTPPLDRIPPLCHPNPDLARSPRPRPPELPCSRSWLCPAARGCSLNGPVSAPFRPFRPSLASGRRCACLFTASQDHHLPSFPVQNRADSPPCRIALECSFLKRAGGFASRLTQPPFIPGQGLRLL